VLEQGKVEKNFEFGQGNQRNVKADHNSISQQPAVKHGISKRIVSCQVG